MKKQLAKKGENVDQLFQRVGCLTFERLLAKESASESRRESKGKFINFQNKFIFFSSFVICKSKLYKTQQVISDIGPKRIMVDEDFHRKTRDQNCPGSFSKESFLIFLIKILIFVP